MSTDHVLILHQAGLRLSVSEGDWTAGWNGSAITATLLPSGSLPATRTFTFSVRAVVVMKLLASVPALLVATTDRKVLVWDLASGSCVRMLTFKSAITDIRSNGTVAGIVLEDLSLHFFKKTQLTVTRIEDVR
jgi:WD40 repeat protein